MDERIEVTLATLKDHNHIIGDIERGIKLYNRGNVEFGRDTNLGYLADIPEKNEHRRVMITFTPDGRDIESFFCNKCALRNGGAICRHVVAGILAIQDGIYEAPLDETLPDMDGFAKDDLDEAKYSIESTLHKCEKALEKLKPGSPQYTLTIRRIRAFRLSLLLIGRELKNLEISGIEA